MTPQQQSNAITEREHELIRFLSDTELYPQAVEFMHGVARPLPPTQINGLLNISFENTFDELARFVEHQQERTTWRREDQHVPDFYRRFSQKLKQLDTYVLMVAKSGPANPSRVHMQTLKMELVRELIQHLLAENGYMATVRAAQASQAQPTTNARPAGNTGTRNTPQQGRPQGGNRGNRGS